MARESNFNAKKQQNVKIRRDKAKNIKKSKKLSAIQSYIDQKKNGIEDEPEALDKKGRRELRKKQIKADKKLRLKQLKEERNNEIQEEQ